MNPHELNALTVAEWWSRCIRSAVQRRPRIYWRPCAAST